MSNFNLPSYKYKDADADDWQTATAEEAQAVFDHFSPRVNRDVELWGEGFEEGRVLCIQRASKLMLVATGGDLIDGEPHGADYVEVRMQLPPTLH